MRLPRLTLRDLLWLVLVVACCCGWLVNRWQLVRENANLRQDIAMWQQRTDGVFRLYKKNGQWIEWYDDGRFQVLDP